MPEVMSSQKQPRFKAMCLTTFEYIIVMFFMVVRVAHAHILIYNGSLWHSNMHIHRQPQLL